MSKTKQIGSLDYFKIIAALLVVSIHTSPFTLFSTDIDFVFTRVIARIAVPFFFMITGYFLLPQYIFEKSKDYFPLLKFIKKTMVLYVVSTIVYIPINIYAGHYDGMNFIKLLRMIFFDGTYYHLWYLPASIIGVLIVCFLGQKLCFTTLALLSVSLYIFGLLGDSYFGLIEQIPIFSNVYEICFSIFNYTRNGLFFVPIFLVMSGWISQKKYNISSKNATIGFVVSIFLMLLEALILRHFSVARHDSMYVFLIPCLFFLFHGLISLNLKTVNNLSAISIFIYIIHPFFIVAIRGVSKILNLEAVLIENSLIHYLLVCLSSCAFAVITEKLMKQKLKESHQTERAWIELDFNNLRHNVKTLQGLMPTGCSLMPVVKANAYGHGAVVISKELNRMGIRNFCVATVLEGVELRKNKVKGEILILGYTNSSQFPLLRKYNLTQTVIDVVHMEILRNYKKKIKVHIKIDTGMHRLGESQIDNILEIFRCNNLQIDGIFTHLYSAETTNPIDKMNTLLQYERFLRVIDEIKTQKFTCPKIHILSSYGLLNYPQFACDYVRVGIALYGELSNFDNEEKIPIDLLPVLSVKARVITVKTLCSGETAGYCGAFIADRESQIAMLSIGYADGISRTLSCGIGNVLINGMISPIVGKICMDQMMIDVTDITDVRVGDIALVIGTFRDRKISTCIIANQTDSIPNEVLTRLGNRLERIIINKG